MEFGTLLATDKMKNKDSQEGEKEMKVNKNFKIGLVVSLMALAISACGKGSTTTSVLQGTSYGTCGTTTGTNVYTGDIISCEEAGYCGYNETIMDGTLTLSVTASSGLVSGQATITGTLTVNESTFCCTSQGLSYVSVPSASLQSSAGAKYVMDGVTLVCQPTNSGYYQSMVLKLGSGDYYVGPSMITTDQKFIGAFEVISGVSFGGNGTNLSFFAN